MSQRLAEEKKAAEETKRFYNEEIVDEDMAEAEFTDPDTSDHEFVQDEAEEGDGESDACSDLDEQERVGEVRGDGPQEIGEGVNGEGVIGDDVNGEGVIGDDVIGEGVIGEGVEKGGEEDEGYSAGDESESENGFSDHEEMMKIRSAKKTQRLFDSDEEREREEGEGERDKKHHLLSGTVRHNRGECDEASMGPLALNGPLEEDSNGEMEGERETHTSFPGVEMVGEADPKPCSEDRGGVDVPPTPAVPESDSLEGSLLWAPSLPPAQPWNDSSVTSDQPGGEGGMSQWAGPTQRFLETHNTSLDEETQFLDANG